MVDLVKIRKKAKEKKEAADAVSRQEAAPAAAPAPPPAEVVNQPLPSALPAEAASVAAEVTTVADAPAAVSEKLETFRRTAGMRRGAEQAVAVEEGEASIAILELLLFTIAGEQYALPIESIVEIARSRATTRVPNADESVIGILSLRGTVVTILDIRRKLGHPAQQTTTDDTRVIVVEFRGETCGFVVDRVSRVVRVNPEEIENHPVVSSSEQSEFIRGVFQYGQKLSILLDLDRLLRF